MIVAVYTSESRVHRMSRVGTKWSCTCKCPKRKPCYPLLMVWGQGFVNPTAKKRLKITKEGRKFVGRLRLTKPEFTEAEDADG